MKKKEIWDEIIFRYLGLNQKVYFTVLSLNKDIEEKAIKLIEKHQLKSLDSIQLASYFYRRTDVRSFIASDAKLKRAAEAESVDVIDPTEFEDD